MIKVKLNNDCKITFQHNVETGVCKAVLQDENGIIAEGEAKKSIREKNYVKETGRKYAIKRLLLGFSKEDRKRVWDAYLNRRAFINNTIPDPVI